MLFVLFVCLFVIVPTRKMSKMAVFDWLFDFLTTFLNVSGRGKKNRILEFSPLSIGRGGFAGFRLLSGTGIPLLSEPFHFVMSVEDDLLFIYEVSAQTLLNVLLKFHEPTSGQRQGCYGSGFS